MTTEITLSASEIISTIKPSELLYWDQAPTFMDERHPIIVFRSTMTIVDGHHRFMYLRNSLRLKGKVMTYPVIFIDTYADFDGLDKAPSVN